MPKDKKYIQMLGWSGAVLILLAYGLTVLQLSVSGTLYHGLNAVGGVFVAYAAVIRRAWPAAFLNIFWFLIAVTGLLLIG